MTSHRDISDQVFLQMFSDCTLDPSVFDHEAHLRLAWLYITNEDIEVALTKVSQSIINYVKHLGAEDKYNHTLTISALHIVHHFIKKSSSTAFEDFIVEFPRLKTNFKDLLMSHYSLDTLQSFEAKEVYIIPDVMPF